MQRVWRNGFFQDEGGASQQQSVFEKCEGTYLQHNTTQSYTFPGNDHTTSLNAFHMCRQNEFCTCGTWINMQPEYTFNSLRLLCLEEVWYEWEPLS